MARGTAAGVLVGDGQGTWAALQVEGLSLNQVKGRKEEQLLTQVVRSG